MYVISVFLVHFSIKLITQKAKAKGKEHKYSRKMKPKEVRILFWKKKIFCLYTAFC